MRAITLGVHVVDVLVRPVERIPDGQGGQLVEEIRITPAGPAGGTAITLGKLGAAVQSAGAIGTDALGDVLLDLLGHFGVDTRCSCAGAACRRRPASCRSGPTDRARHSTSSAPTPPTPRPTRPGRRSPQRPTCTSALRSSWAAPRPPRFFLRPGARGRHLGRHPRPRRSGRGGAGLDRTGVRAPRLPAAQRGAGARPHRRGRAARWLPGAAGSRRRVRGRHLRRRRRDRGRPRRGPRPFPPSRSMSSTPRAAATPSPPASCAAARSDAPARGRAPGLRRRRPGGDGTRV